ncbi:hypothetical protein D3C86_938490 [compost metagenome]
MALCAGTHPCVVRPGIGGGVVNDRSGGRRGLGAARHGVGLENNGARVVGNGELVAIARHDARDEQFPHAGRVAQAHGVAAGIPAIEVAHHGNAARIGRPDRAAQAGHAVHLIQMRAQHGQGGAPVAAGQAGKIGIGQHRAESVGVGRELFGVGPLDGQLVRARVAGPGVGHGPGVQALGLFVQRQARAVGGYDRDRAGAGDQCAHHAIVRTQDRKRVRVLAGGQGLQAGRIKLARLWRRRRGGGQGRRRRSAVVMTIHRDCSSALIAASCKSSRASSVSAHSGMEIQSGRWAAS